MLSEQPIRLELNPIDTIETIFEKKSLSFERRTKNEVVVEVEGKWNNMLLFVAWEQSLCCLHLSCLMNINAKISDLSRVFELLALVNENLWLGHFSFWSAHKMPIFKHSVIINPNEVDFLGKIEQMMEIAVNECEQMYPVFDAVITNRVSPQQALMSEHLFVH